jgi:hypothetical protein
MAAAAAGFVVVLALVAAVLLLRGGDDAATDGPQVELALDQPTEVVITVVYDGELADGETVELARISPDGAVDTISAAADLTPVTDAGLEPETQYGYRVRITGGAVDGEWSPWTPITTGAAGSAASAGDDEQEETTVVTLGEGNTGEEPDLDAPLPSLTDVDLAIRPTSLDFGPVAVGEQRQLEVAVFNNSDIGYDLGGVTIAGVGYSVDASSCSPEIPGRSSCTIVVTFTPQGEGVEQAVLSSSVRGALAQASGDGKAPEGGSLTVTLVGTGSGTVSSDPAGLNCDAECTTTFDAGAEVTLTANPAADSLFLGWSGVDCAPGPSCVVTLSGPKNILAVFDLAPPSTSLTVDVAGSGSGTVVSNPAGISCPGTCTADFAPGTEVSLSASAADGSTFTGWRGGDCPTEGGCTVTVTGGQSILAVFEQGGGSGRLQVDIVGLGTGSITSTPGGVTCAENSCTGNFAPGTEVTLTPVPDAGSAFIGWSGGGCPQGTEPCVVTVAELTSVLAEFGEP